MNFFLSLTVSFFSLISFSQDFGSYIAKHAITISDSSRIYHHLKDYDLIMVGEMHGTNEPAELVNLFAEILLKYSKDSISVGLEVPASEMREFLNNQSDSTLKLSHFFSKENTDGRNGRSWFDLIQHTYKKSKVDVFFFDNYEELQIENRDSAMYLSLVDQRNRFKNRKIITLSGNLHNSMVAFGEMTTMGSFCKADSVSFRSICSINHTYSQGEMFNNQGEGVHVHSVPFSESVYSRSTELEKYLVFYQTVSPSPNNCIF